MLKHLLISTVLLGLAPAASAQTAQGVRSAFGPGRSGPHTTTAPQRGAAPANDDCSQAQAIAVATDCSSPVSGDNTNATQDGAMPSCDVAGTYLDVWYVFDAGDADTVAIDLTPANPNAQDWNFAVYDACGGNELYCSINPSAVQNVPVVPNASNWIRVWSNTAFAPGGAFTLCVTAPSSMAVPPNDLCSSIAPSALAIGGTLTFTGTNEGALDNEGQGTPCVWVAFTTTACADVHIDYCGTTPRYQHFLLPLWTGCPGVSSFTPGSYGICSPDSNFTLCYAHVAAGTYYYAIGQAPGSVGPYTLHVSAEACSMAEASNDECMGALSLATSAVCAPQTFSPSCASQSMAGITCDGSTGDANDDVWYSFTATQSDMSIGVLPHGNMDPVMQVFSGACGSLVPFDCADVNGSGASDDLQMSGLTVGNTYYLRVYDFRMQYAWADPSYDLCVVEGLGSGVGMEEQPAEAGTMLFPNPTDGAFTVQLDPQASSITIIDATGRVVLRKPVAINTGLMHVDASGLSPGRYTVRCEGGSRVTFHGLVVVR